MKQYKGRPRMGARKNSCQKHLNQKGLRFGGRESKATAEICSGSPQRREKNGGFDMGRFKKLEHGIGGSFGCVARWPQRGPKNGLKKSVPRGKRKGKTEGVKRSSSAASLISNADRKRHRRGEGSRDLRTSLSRKGRGSMKVPRSEEGPKEKKDGRAPSKGFAPTRLVRKQKRRCSNHSFNPPMGRDARGRTREIKTLRLLGGGE